MCGLSFICPGTYAPGSICLPCIPMPCGIHGRAALNGYYTWHFSMQGLPANDVTVISRGLLPHVFNLALRSFSEGGLALWQFSLKACPLAILLEGLPSGNFPLRLSPSAKATSGGNFLWHSLSVFQQAGCSPVHCSVLSGLSSPPLQEER